MQRKFYAGSFLFIGVLTLITGCVSTGIDPAVTARAADTATIYIIQPTSSVNLSFTGGLTLSKANFQLWDNDTWLGYISSKNYIVYYAKPGTHYFMAKAANWDVVKVEVRAGKTYYLKTTDLPGFNAPSVKLEPVNPTDPELQSWLDGSKEIIPKNKASAYMLTEAQTILQRVKNGEAEFKPFPVSWAK
ncbi:MAG: DUF2846 domain-containing protein [Spirochaetaceae bacterium]|jgi:hypothetical protein|nr:DUF2846 domain-containing protein [Spirochaetaceae bacterium]